MKALCRHTALMSTIAFLLVFPVAASPTRRHSDSPNHAPLLISSSTKKDAKRQAKRRAALIKAGPVASRALAGRWGGEHIGLSIDNSGARVEYDCGGGTIDEPIVLSRAGRFNVRGTDVRGHGGPVRADEQPDRHPARYAGKVTGQTMIVTVMQTDIHQKLGTFTLRQGQDAQLQRCY